MPLPGVWPLFNVINIINLDEKKCKSVNETDSYNWYTELFVRHLRLSTYFIIASLVYYYTFPSYSSLLHDPDSFSWWFKWSCIILTRDLIITLVTYSGWHWFLYESRYAARMKRLKFNPEYPDQSQWTHDRFWSLSGTAISTLFELFMIWYYRRYGVAQLVYPTFNSASLSTVLWLLFIPYWRDGHFYWIHRFIHPWNFTICSVDIGRILYRDVHSLHHKSYNTGPWSGLSMHPVEHLFYYSCMLVPTVFGVKQHPIHLLFNKFHATVSPLPGHDGFDSPGGGSYFHFLHHAHFECNYGTPMVPFDELFGTYEDGRKYREMKSFDSVNDQ
eukprot:171436_1